VACQSRERTADDTDGVALFTLSQPQSSHLTSHISQPPNSHPSNGTMGTQKLRIRVGETGNGQTYIRIRPRQVPEISRVREHITIMKVARIERLIPPRQRIPKITLIPQRHLKRPQKVPMPDQELRIPVDIRHVHLMQARKILVSTSRWGIVPTGGSTHHAFYGVHQADS